MTDDIQHALEQIDTGHTEAFGLVCLFLPQRARNTRRHSFFTTEGTEYTEAFFLPRKARKTRSASFITTEGTEDTECVRYGGGRLFYNPFYCRFGIVPEIY